MKKIILACLLFYFQTYAQRACRNNAQVDDPKLQGEYRGQCEDGEAHGKGSAKGKYTYKGDFERGKKHGKGIYKTTNYVYKGNFELDFFSGQGELKYFEPSNNKYVYKGTWVEGKKDGEGELETNDYKYVGGWQEDLKHGKGNIFFKDKRRYEGEWKADLKHGQGKFYYADPEKSVYDGFWKDDKRSGKGKFSNKNYTYQGLWEDDKRSRQGKMIKREGKITRKYEGDWQDDVFHGRGKYEYIYKRPNHKKSFVYEGEFENGNIADWGTMTFGKSGDTYEGNWYEGKPDTYGIYTFAKTQTYYEGEWQDGKKHGLGIKYYKTGDIKTKAGRWYQGSFEEERDFSTVRRYLDKKYVKYGEDTKPAKLLVINNIVQIEPSETLQPNKTYELIFGLKNEGEGTAQEVKIKLNQKEFKSGFEYEDKTLGSLKSGETITVSLPIKTTQDLHDGTVTFILEITEKRGYDAPATEISYNTSGIKNPILTLKNGVFTQAGNVHTFNLELHNAGQGAAQNIMLEAIFPATANIAAQTSQTIIRHFQTLGPNQLEAIDPIKFTVNPKDLAAGIEIKVKTKANNFTEFTESFFYQKTAKKKKTEGWGGFVNPNNIVLTSDVDKNLPTTNSERENAVAIIMGVSNYKNARNVDYALHDAKAVEKYIIEVLGFKPKNVKIYLDPGLGDFNGLFGGSNQTNLGELDGLINSETELFFFYAGHGAPMIEKNTTFLLPSDASSGNLEGTAYPLDKLYQKFAQLKPAKLTVIIDACFSGIQTGFYEEKSIQFNNDDLPDNSSTIFDKPNYILLTAAAKNQYANWYTTKKHSLFTYYFLKGLQTKADNQSPKALTYKELYDYTKSRVEKFSNNLGKLEEQVPQIHGAAQNNIFVEYKTK